MPLPETSSLSTLTRHGDDASAWNLSNRAHRSPHRASNSSNRAHWASEIGDRSDRIGAFNANAWPRVLPHLNVLSQPATPPLKPPSRYFTIYFSLFFSLRLCLVPVKYFPERKIFSSVWLYSKKYFGKYFLVFGCILENALENPFLSCFSHFLIFQTNINIISQ